MRLTIGRKIDENAPDGGWHRLPVAGLVNYARLYAAARTQLGAERARRLSRCIEKVRSRFVAFASLALWWWPLLVRVTRAVAGRLKLRIQLADQEVPQRQRAHHPDHDTYEGEQSH
jgi:hypothetical protein